MCACFPKQTNPTINVTILLKKKYLSIFVDRGRKEISNGENIRIFQKYRSEVSERNFKFWNCGDRIVLKSAYKGTSSKSSKVLKAQ